MEESQTQQLGKSTLELKYFALTHGILKATTFNSLTFIILKIVQNIQFFYYILALKILSDWNKSIMVYPKYLINYINLDFLFKLNPSQFFSILLVSTSINLLIILWMGILSCYVLGKGTGSLIFKISFPVLGFILLLYRTFLQIPFITVFVYSFAIFQYPQLKSSLSAEIIILISVINLIMFILIETYILTSLRDCNPFSQVIFAGETSMKRLLTLIYKAFFVLYPIIDTNGSFQLGFLITTCIVNLLWVIGCHLQTVSYYNEKLKFFCLWLTYLQFWISFSLFVHLLIKSHLATLKFIVVMSVISIYAMYYFDKVLKSESLKKNFIMLKQSSDIEYHITGLIKFIDTLEKRESRIILMGYLMNHRRSCKYSPDQCCCQCVENRILHDGEIKLGFFGLVIDLLKNCLKRVEDQKKIHLLLSFIYQNRQKNRFQAIYSVTRILDDSSLRDRLEFYRQIQIIEAQMIEDDNKQNQNTTIDIGKFFMFNMKIVIFEELLEKCSIDHIDFWKELLEMNINLKKVGEYGALITNEKDNLKEFFQELQEMNPNNAHTLILFGKFLMEICNDQTNNYKYLEKAQLILKNLKESTKVDESNEKYNDNAQTTIIIISGNEKQLGKIVQTNNIVSKSLGYYRRELISQNVALIMPKIFADFHNNVLSRYLSTSSERFNGKERMVPVLAKSGYMQPCYALTKALPNLQKGIQIVGFVSVFEEKNDEDPQQRKYSYILYDTKCETIMGISQTCESQFGIPVSLVYGNPNNNGNELKIKNIFGSTLERIEDEGTGELMAEINTKNLANEFIITKNQSVRKIGSEKITDVNKGKYAEVFVKSTLNLVYNGTPLRVISFYDINDDFKEEEKLQNVSLKPIQINGNDESANTENEELKDLKDFKNFISIKSEPSAIRSIKYACIILIFLLCVGISLMIFLWFSISENFSKYIESNSDAFVSRMMMTEILFETQKIFINENDKFVNGHQFPLNQTISQLEFMIDKAKENQIFFLPLKMELLSNYNKKVKDYYATSTGTIDYSKLSIDEAIAFILTKVHAIVVSDKTQLSAYPLNYSLGLVQGYSEVKHTTIFSILPGNKDVHEDLVTSQKEKNEAIKMNVYIINSFMVLFFIIWIFVSLPQVLSVTRINNRVMSLFSLISEFDVNNIIRGCFRFEKKFLTEAIVDDDEIANDVPNEPAFDNTISNNLSLFSPKDSQIRLNVRKPEKEGKKMEMKDVEEKLKAIQNSQQNNDKGLLTTNYVFISVFLLTFILFSCFYTQSIIIQNSEQFEIIYTLSRRATRFRQIKLSFVEFLESPNLSMNSKTLSDINNEMIDEIYSIERALLNFQYSTSYSSTLAKFNTKNLCDDISMYKKYKIYDNLSFSKSECEEVGNGILKKGIKTAIVTSLEEIRYYLSISDTEWQSLDRQQILIDTIQKYKILQKYIETPLIMITEMIKNQRLSNFQVEKLIFMIVSGIFVLLMLLFWRIVWQFYISNLNEKVWRTKGMLNLIPTKIITDNQLLKNQFTSGELEKAVR